MQPLFDPEGLKLIIKMIDLEPIEDCEQLKHLARTGEGTAAQRLRLEMLLMKERFAAILQMDWNPASADQPSEGEAHLPLVIGALHSVAISIYEHINRCGIPFRNPMEPQTASSWRSTSSKKKNPKRKR